MILLIQCNVYDRELAIEKEYITKEYGTFLKYTTSLNYSSLFLSCKIATHKKNSYCKYRRICVTFKRNHFSQNI